MQSCFIIVGLVLMGQVGGVGGPRYDTSEYDTPKNNGTVKHPWEKPPVTPREEATTQPTGQALFDTQPQQPASSTSSLRSATDSAISKPSELLRWLMTPPLRGPLLGTPLSLAEAVSGSRSRAEQTARVEAYWDLSVAVTDYYLAMREATELETLRQSVSRPSFVWDEARLALTSRTQVARRSAEAAQYRLQSLLGRSAESGLPLPSDPPHSGAYQTRYEKNFAGRQSAEAGQLNELLPQIVQDLRTQAAAMTADQQWLQTVDQQRDPQSDGTVLLKTYELLSLRRRTFINSVSQYNTMIARYAELATPDQVGTDRLVAMLIGAPPISSTSSRSDSNVTRTSAEEPIDSQIKLRTSPRTFVEENREPTSKSGEERSILIKPDESP